MDFGLVKSGLSWLKRSFSDSDEEERNANSQIPVEESTPPTPEGQGSSHNPFLGDDDIDDEMPEVIGTSAIFQDGEILKLCPYLPSRLIGATWKLIFSTESDGFSLKSIYRRMANYFGVPTLLLIQDTEGYRFGALVSDNFRLHDAFYGTGETFLFRLSPDFQCYPWRKKNNMVISCSNDCLSIGASEGHFGITLDSDLNHGRTLRCDTYDNEPLNPGEDFSVKIVEIWTFH